MKSNYTLEQYVNDYNIVEGFLKEYSNRYDAGTGIYQDITILNGHLTDKKSKFWATTDGNIIAQKAATGWALVYDNKDSDGVFVVSLARMSEPFMPNKISAYGHKFVTSKAVLDIPYDVANAVVGLHKCGDLYGFHPGLIAKQR